MNERIRELLDQMAALEAELGAELQKQEQHLTFKIKGNYIKFEQGIEAAHRKLKLGFSPGCSAAGRRTCLPDRSSTA